MSYTLFISPARVKKLTGIYEVFYDEDIAPYVLQAQDIYVQEKLGTTFYQSLKTKVLSGTTSSYEQVLLNEYIAPMLAQFAVYLALPHIHYKIKNKSVLNGTSEDGTPATLGDIKYLKAQTLDTAQFYGERMREYLRANDEHFDEYRNWDEDYMAPNKFNTYSQGIYIPKPYGCGIYGTKDDNGISKTIDIL